MSNHVHKLKRINREGYRYVCLSCGKKLKIMSGVLAKEEPKQKEPKPSHRAFARIVARGENDVVLGKNLNGLLKTGVVYEIVECVGVLTIREVGPSQAAQPGSNMYGGSLTALDAYSPEDLMVFGNHLLTPEEYERSRNRGKQS